MGPVDHLRRQALDRRLSLNPVLYRWLRPRRASEPSPASGLCSAGLLPNLGGVSAGSMFESIYEGVSASPVSASALKSSKIRGVLASSCM